ncbi:helix-hairpin-helix domain-containing protein [Streptomyces sp. C1-1]|uniref:helix-hairpin-helix domain-containing protein n=1 Tax=Streptomyces sp. C1-1 TaxID=3231173 RepID=UPI003CFC7458
MDRGNDIMGAADGGPRTHELTRIEGIGPKIASRLAASGVRDCADLAGRSGDEIIGMLPDITGLSSAKVERWRVRAREMAAGAEPPVDNRPYENFLVRLLLDERGSIRRTTVEHVQSGEGRRWAAWEREALLDFIESRVAAPPAQGPHAAGERAPEPSPEPVAPEAGGQVAEPGDASGRHSVAPGLTLVLGDRHPLHADSGFDMAITLDLAAAAVHADRLAYHAIVVARQLGTKTRFTVASEDGLIPVSAPVIRLEGRGLPVGVYRLEAVVGLREPGTEHAGGLAATAEGLMLEVPAN